jgi:Spy/CpxP family protein refolding chaperone
MMKEPSENANLTAPIRRPHRWRMVLSGLVILAAGVTLGIAGTLLVVGPESPRPPMPPNMAAGLMLGRFRDELNLSPDQVEQLKGILETRMKKLDEIRLKARPEIEEQLELMKSEISEVLTPEQQNRWQEIMERLERMFRRGMRRGPGGRGGPGPGGPEDRFRDGRRPFRGRGRPDPNDPNRPREWRPDGRRPGEGRPPWRGRPDANDVPPPPEPFGGDRPPGNGPGPNQP